MTTPPTGTFRFLAAVERAGNKLPDPAMLFLAAMLIVWVVSWLAAGYAFSVPGADGARDLSIQNQLSGSSLATFLSQMVKPSRALRPSGLCWWLCWESALPSTPASSMRV
jgi:aminobenzoyl-glutamate transport protein